MLFRENLHYNSELRAKEIEILFYRVALQRSIRFPVHATRDRSFCLRPAAILE
jgi:hypothetical protein